MVDPKTSNKEEMPMLFLNSVRTGLFIGAVALAGCATEAPSDQTPGSLDELVVPSADFTFATSRAISVQLDAKNGPAAIEVRDSENRRLMQGAFRESVNIDLKLPLGLQPRLTVRSGLGDNAIEQTIDLDEAGRGTAEY